MSFANKTYGFSKMCGRFLLICNRARNLDTALCVLTKNSNIVGRTTNCLRKIYVLEIMRTSATFFQFSKGRFLNGKIFKLHVSKMSKRP